jgi:hypothetical protein
MALGNWGVSSLTEKTGLDLNGSEYLRDYTHAARTFRTNSYQYAPKLKFLFHVYFEINPGAYDIQQDDTKNLSLVVKSVQLPSYTFDTHQLNQYNRKRIVQTKIKYDAIEIAFHDDNLNLVRNMWFNYFAYYYNDPSKPISITAGRTFPTPELNPNNSVGISDDYNKRNLYQGSITGDNGWGFIGETSKVVNSSLYASLGESKVPFFKNITIFGFNQHNFVAYTLINPIITRFAHDQYNYAEGGGIMENKMTVDYETVKYFDGAIDGNTPDDIIKGFGSPGTYDRRLSPVAIPGSQSRILGQGGLTDGALCKIQDLTNSNPQGGQQQAGVAYNTYKNMNNNSTLTTVTTEVSRVSAFVGGGGTRNLNFDFPVANQTPGPGQAGSPVGQSSPETISGSGTAGAVVIEDL